MSTSRILIKLGGAALQSNKTLATASEAIRQYCKSGHQVIMVHGGGPAINQALVNQGIQWTFVDGQRVTTPQMMSIIEDTLCNEVNRRVVDYFCAHGLEAKGFSGAQNQTLLCQKASGSLGQVGQIAAVHSEWLEPMINNGVVPLVAPIGTDNNGIRYNINADWSATHLAVSLKVDELIFLTDMNGILDEKAERIANANVNELEHLVNTAVVTGGMLTKTRAVIHALKNGIHKVRILKGDDADQLLQKERLGTLCLSQSMKNIEPSHVI